MKSVASLLEHYSIGRKLRALRQQRRLTLSTAAAQSGFSTALLSKLESDQMIPTLPTLAGLCRLYGVGLSHFFAEAQRHSIAITRKETLSAARRERDGIKETPLHPWSSNEPLCARIVDFPPDVVEAVAAMDGCLHCAIYVVEGSLKIESGGLREILNQGDFACLSTEMATFWGSEGRGHCRALVVSGAARQRPTAGDANS